MSDLPGEPAIHVLDDPDAVSRAAAEVIVAALRDAIGRRSRADWATTGGSAPGGIYQHLARAPLRDEVQWDAVHVWWGDDRYVPRDHPQSNVLPLDQILLSASGRAGISGTGSDAALVELGIEPGVMLPPENVHAPRMAVGIGGEGLEWVARDYEAELRSAGPAVSESGYPSFDVLLLGIGPDGHLLSVFPGSALLESDAWVSAVPAPSHVEPHLDRVSLNPRVIEVAATTIVVAHGASKADILATVFGPERDARRWPAQLALRTNAQWFLDRAAAAKLPR